jgi:multisubunit Na+/H+ antiporter MnhF subunit
MGQELPPDRGRSVRVDLRLVTVGALVAAIGALVALLVVAGSDAALTKTALVLAVVAFVADLVIALASYMIAAQSEARLQQTNSQMQMTLGSVQEQTNEIRNLARMQVTDLIDRLAPRVIAESQPEVRPQVRDTLAQLRDEAQALQSDLQQPRQDDWQSRQQWLLTKVKEWADANGWERLLPPPGTDIVPIRINGIIYAIMVHAGDARTFGWSGVYYDFVRRYFQEKWATDVRMAVVFEDLGIVSNWDGESRTVESQHGVIRAVRVSNLDDILSDDLPKTDVSDSDNMGFIE